MFSPGETIGFTFVIPFMRVDLSEVIVSFKQDGHIVLERHVTSKREFLEHRDKDGNIDPIKTEIRIILSQEESLMFEELKNYTIQLNVYTDGGSRHASCELKGTNAVQHHKEVMSNG